MIAETALFSTTVSAVVAEALDRDSSIANVTRVVAVLMREAVTLACEEIATTDEERARGAQVIETLDGWIATGAMSL